MASAGVSAVLSKEELFKLSWDGSKEGSKEGRKAALRTFRSLALHQGRQFKQSRKGGQEKVIMECTSCDAKATLRRAANVWRWREEETMLTHVNCVSQSKANAEDVANLQSVHHAITKGDCSAQLKEVQSHAASNGLNISTTGAHRAKRRILDEDETDYIRSYELIHPWLKDVATKNPNTEITFLRDEDGCFAAAGFVLGDVAEIIMKCGVPVTNLDGTFFDDGQYKGKLLIIESVLADGIRCPLGVLVHHSENKEAFQLLLNMLLRVPGMRQWLDSVDHTLISDRGSGLVPAVKACLKETKHVWCSDHLLRNAVDNSKRFHEEYWRRIVYAKTPMEFTDAISALEAVAPRAAEYIRNIPPETYQLDACCTAGIRKWGRSASTLVEGENGRLKAHKFRAGSPLNALAGALSIQLGVVTRLAKLVSSLPEKQILNKVAAEKFDEAHNRARICVVEATANPFVYIVKQMEMKEDSKLRTIDLSAPFTRHGACVTCHQEMRPCEHLLACAYKCKETHGFFLPGVSSSDDFIKAVHHKTYLAQSVREAIAGKEVRLADSEMLVRWCLTMQQSQPSHIRRLKETRGSSKSASQAEAKTRRRRQQQRHHLLRHLLCCHRGTLPVRHPRCMGRHVWLCRLKLSLRQSALRVLC
ncbi:SWIM-type domain-containing protein [Pseudoscourfieldia marina]